ncbi:uncharacterized protein LOC128223688 isoform X2 [Mya arenaria]|uniref:uncharacterized protein LOC128223688 isoform X2 n=1 Tax=Mya arenaria TaxID=6604 RepID=UPI0022DF168D|nr:uncharacterized protein LOC128223688 isoform X2 [Mya arenaria]
MSGKSNNTCINTSSFKSGFVMVKIDAYNPKKIVKMDWIFILLLPSVIPVFEAAVCNKNDCCPGTEKDSCINETKEECLIAKPIHNILRRITGYQTQDDEYPFCDFYISPGWYTLCGHVLSTNRTGCGTVFNWIRTGALPEDGPDLVDVCLTKKDEGECLENSQVNASKCHDGTYVFYLVDTQSCPEAYCIESAVVTTNKDSMCTVNANEKRCEGCCVNDSECLAINGECVFNVSSDVGKCKCRPGSVFRDGNCSEETKEECLIAKPIHNIPRRIIGYQPQDDEYPLCDFYISPGWYTLCGHVLSTNRTGCGTVFNWIRTGALLEDGPDLVDVCLTKKDEGECLENSQVNASKCHDGTYVFYLVDTQSCPEAYCIESAVVTTNEDSMCTVNANEKRCEGCCVNDSECLAINGECVFNVPSDVGKCKCRPGSVFRDGNCSEETKEECLIAKPIHNIPRRIIGYQPQDDEYPLCDFYISPGWYTLCGHVLSTNRTGCGTVFNWIRTGALPEDGPDLVDVCLTKKDEGECLENSQVNASKCQDGTYVFYLVDTQSCPEAYCIESAVLNTNEEQRCEGCCVNDGDCLAIDGECVFNGSSNVSECRCRPGSVLRDETCSEEQRCEGCCVNDGDCLAIDGECVFNGSSNVGECGCRPGSVLRDETCSEEKTTAKLEDTSKLKFVLAISFLLCGGIAAVAIITCLTCRQRKKTASNTEDKIGVYDEISHDPYTKLETGKACEKTQYYPILFVVEGSKDIYPTKGRFDEMNDDHVYTTI